MIIQLKKMNVEPMSVSEKPTKKERATIEFANVEKIEKATKLPESKPRITFFVADYTKFVNSKWNRNPAPNLRLKADLDQWGQLIPITVLKDKETGKLTVVNGWHTLHYSKELGLPVECIELPECYQGSEFDAVKSTNIKSIPWVTGANGDFMNIYVKDENSNYIKLRDLVALLRDLSETIIYNFVTGKSGLKEIYERGTLVFDPKPEQEERLTLLNSLVGQIITSRTLSKTKSYFDKPAIVKLLDTFLNRSEGYKIHILEAALRKDGYRLNKASKIEELEGYYQEFTN